MASEIEDCTSFQADCLSTGSISFGKFEAESLSWERRSSFSRNQYLEEVKKYSTPGSVTKKKAYFEAHFKKKAIQHQDSTGDQNGTDVQIQNGIENQCIHMEEFENHGNKGALQFEEFVNHDNDGIQFSWYDVTPDISDEYEVEEIEKEEETLSCDWPIKATCNNDESHESASDTNFVLVHCTATGKTPSGCDTSAPVDNSVGLVVVQKSENEVENVDAEKMNALAKSSAAEKITVSSSKKISEASLKEKSTVEHRPSQMKSRMGVSTAQIVRKTSTGKNYLSSGRLSAKVSQKIEKETPVRMKQSPSIIPRSTHYGPKNVKTEDSHKMKAKMKQVNQSSLLGGKGDKTPSSVLIHPSTSHKDQAYVRLSTNRAKQVSTMMKSDTRSSAAVSSFKSDKRADKRKEEEAEPEIKQLQRGLKFKATPMPSFYQDADQKDSVGRKVVNGPAKSLKLQNKCPSAGSRGVPRANSPVFSKTLNPGGPSSEQPSNSQQECLTTLEGGNGFVGSVNGAGKIKVATDLKKMYQPGTKVGAVKKDVRTKVNLQQQHGVSKTRQGDGVKQVRSEGKVIKGVPAGSVAVRVAS